MARGAHRFGRRSRLWGRGGGDRWHFAHPGEEEGEEEEMEEEEEEEVREEEEVSEEEGGGGSTINVICSRRLN